jgi:cytochrome c553
MSKNIFRSLTAGFLRLLAPALLSAGVCLGAPEQSELHEFFETRIRPILANNCYSCHTTTAMGGLKIDSREGLIKGGKSGPAIVPGKPEESLLIRAVRQVDERLKMPMGSRLKDQEIADLTTWIGTGAPWPESPKVALPARTGSFEILPEQRSFWAFQAVHQPEPPKVKDEGWVKTPIDRFVLSQLEAGELKPVGAADKRTLIRRATFDLTGLPPTPEEVKAFFEDGSPKAFAKLVERLLASPHYGERWGRYWLDVARYGEDDIRGTSQESYPNAFRYRDWVIKALNDDLPYDLFVKAQIAGDLLPGKDREGLMPGLGFFGLGPWAYDTTVPLQARADERHDKVDVLTRGFLGLTVACARCHDHKFDPISMKDYYALAGIFYSSPYQEYPLAPADVVEAYHQHQQKIKNLEEEIKQFTQTQSTQLSEIFASNASLYMVAAAKVLSLDRDMRQTPGASNLTPSANPAASASTVSSVSTEAANSSRTESNRTACPLLPKIAEAEKLDAELLERWVKYLANPERDHPYLAAWDKAMKASAAPEVLKPLGNELQSTLLSIIREKKEIDDRNHIILEQSKPAKTARMTSLPNGFSTYEEFCPGCNVSVESLDRNKFVLWSELVGEKGVLHFEDEPLDRRLGPLWISHLNSRRAELQALQKASPRPYPYFHGLADTDQPGNLKIHLRGSPFNLGDETPRRFLEILSDETPRPFASGSGRLQLAEAIARHPLTARVVVNRIWMHHFGRGIVMTPSNFGRLGDRPSHPELLEYLASRLISGKWSIKSLHREIMLSAAYQLSSERSEKNFSVDPDNRLLWRANRRRLDAEATRDALLLVSGNLSPILGGPSSELDAGNSRRTVYGKVSRFKLNSTLDLFDFPNPSITNEQRNVTHVPLQKLFFLNSDFIAQESVLLAERLKAQFANDDALKIRRAYQLCFGRDATESEVQLGLDFLRKRADRPVAGVSPWQQYSQVLLSSNEFVFVD